ncbi:MAG: anthranilate phosphoribosyltransferase [Verrucomicrobiota bacterium]|nr:anthranilate phosphoribosyltransferase [Verrucomicrobiota bacterium]
MSMLESLTRKLVSRESLDESEAAGAALLLLEAEVSAVERMEFLRALAHKGETPVEVAAFAHTFRRLARNPGLEAWAGRAVDIVGTGGDHFGSYNISTTAAFITAAGGVPVIKHGNRAITSQSGTSDFLGALGVATEATSAELLASLESLNFCFLFAPAYHPAFKELMPVRKALAAEGQRTIFNLLGPLINPAQPAHLLMGVFAETWVKPLATALGSLGVKRGLVCHGRLSEVASGLDELTTAGDNRIAGFGELAAMDTVFGAALFGLRECEPEVLKGGTAAQNVEMLGEIAAGTAPGGLTDTVLFNAGAAFWVAGKAETLIEGIAQARTIVESGALRDWLLRLKAFNSRGTAVR